jgi:hypothetical protein
MSPGLDSEPSSDGGLNLGFVANGSWTRLVGVDFGGAPATSLTLRYATPQQGSVVTVIVDGEAPAGLGGTVLAACEFPSTGDWQVWETLSCNVSVPVTGVHAVYFVFTGALLPPNGLLNLRWWRFAGGAASGAVPPPVSANVTVQSSSTGLYWGPPVAGSGLVFPNASVAGAHVFGIYDAEDGTYWLGSPNPGAYTLCMTGPEGSGSLTSIAWDPLNPCTRFWLYGTTAGQLVAATGNEGAPSYALLSAASGQLLVATAPQSTLWSVGFVDPRNATGDAARFFVATVPQL